MFGSGGVIKLTEWQTSKSNVQGINVCASRGIFGVDKYLYLPKYLNTLGIITNPCPSYLFDPHMFSVTLGVLLRKAWLHVKFEFISFVFMLNALPHQQGLGRRTQPIRHLYKWQWIEWNESAPEWYEK